MSGELPDLTTQEQQVLALVVQGRTNRQIRQRASLSEYNLTRTLKQLYFKTGLHRPSQPYVPRDLRARLVQWGRAHQARVERR